MLLKIFIGLLVLWVAYRTWWFYDRSRHVRPKLNRRVALCISGQLRTFRHCYPTLKKFIIDRYNTDIYLCIDDDDRPEDIRDALELYQPVRWVIIDKSIYTKEDGVCWNKTRAKRYGYLHRMGIKMLKCDEMVKESATHYDATIRIRPDLFLFEYIPDFVIAECAKHPLAIWCPAVPSIFQLLAYPFVSKTSSSTLIDDQFIIGYPSAMYKLSVEFCTIVLDEDRLCNYEERIVFADLPYNNDISGENIMTYAVENAQLKLNKGFRCTNAIIRTDGSFLHELMGAIKLIKLKTRALRA